jgi:hypothetical protein
LTVLVLAAATRRASKVAAMNASDSNSPKDVAPSRRAVLQNPQPVKEDRES